MKWQKLLVYFPLPICRGCNLTSLLGDMRRIQCDSAWWRSRNIVDRLGSKRATLYLPRNVNRILQEQPARQNIHATRRRTTCDVRLRMLVTWLFVRFEFDFRMIYQNISKIFVFNRSSWSLNYNYEYFLFYTNFSSIYYWLLHRLSRFCEKEYRNRFREFIA